MSTGGYEEVTTYPLADEVRDHVLESQNECSFLWGTKDHWPIGVIPAGHPASRALAASLAPNVVPRESCVQRSPLPP